MPVTLADRAVSLGLWTTGLGWLVPMMTGMFGLSLVVSPRRTDWLNRVYCLGQMRAVGAKWRAVVDPPRRGLVRAQTVLCDLIFSGCGSQEGKSTCASKNRHRGSGLDFELEHWSAFGLAPSVRARLNISVMEAQARVVVGPYTRYHIDAAVDTDAFR